MGETKINIEPGYEPLSRVLMNALDQAQLGKGKERHADGESFDQQVICEVGRRVGLGYQLGQAVKKIYESQRLEGEHGVNELLGAINYISAAIIVRREKAAADIMTKHQPEFIHGEARG